VRVFICDQEVITKFSSLYGRGVGGCGLNELTGSCGVLFLREQVSDLRVQEFLREFIVGVVTLSDLVRSIIMKIFHSSEVRDIEQVARTSKQYSRVCDAHLSQLTYVYILYAYYLCAHLLHA